MKLTRKIKKVQEDLRKILEQEYRHPIRISVREEAGPLGMKVIVASNPQAHPGTGMKRVLMDDDGTTYGIHGEKDISNLFHQKGWLENLPDAATFLKLLNQANYEGIGKFSENDCRFVKNGSLIEFHFVKIEHPSGERVKMVIIF